MAKAYILTKAASADLLDIVRHTNEQWGEEQCRSYVAGLEKAAHRLALGEGHFKDLSFIYPSLRGIKSGSHFIFCLPRPKDTAVILAILHERMDLVARIKTRLS